MDGNLPPSMLSPMMWPEFPMNGNRQQYQQQWHMESLNPPLWGREEDNHTFVTPENSLLTCDSLGNSGLDFIKFSFFFGRFNKEDHIDEIDFFCRVFWQRVCSLANWRWKCEQHRLYICYIFILYIYSRVLAVAKIVYITIYNIWISDIALAFSRRLKKRGVHMPQNQSTLFMAWLLWIALSFSVFLKLAWFPQLEGKEEFGILLLTLLRGQFNPLLILWVDWLILSCKISLNERTIYCFKF